MKLKKIITKTLALLSIHSLVLLNAAIHADEVSKETSGEKKEKTEKEIAKEVQPTCIGN